MPDNASWPAEAKTLPERCRSKLPKQAASETAHDTTNNGGGGGKGGGGEGGGGAGGGGSGDGGGGEAMAAAAAARPARASGGCGCACVRACVRARRRAWREGRWGVRSVRGHGGAPATREQFCVLLRTGRTLN